MCICSIGFFQEGAKCVKGKPCPVNTIKAANGSCDCKPGFKNYGGICSQCPPGAFWSSASQKCVFVCGQNSAYSTAANACKCLDGFGLMGGLCQECPANYFVSNGYCVTCPVNSKFNAATNNCDCNSGYFTNQFGICTQKCGTNEEFNPATHKCGCIKGLGRISGVCTVCPPGTQAAVDGSSCSNCGPNEMLNNGLCICKQGFAHNSAKVCTACHELTNGFLINGFCSVCPKTMVVIGGRSCGCPSGKVLKGSMCVSQCQSDELLDVNGNCFTCGSNQVISNGQCVCSTGYSLNSCGVCTLTCGSGQFPFQGGCAICPLNTIYKAEINGCDCPSGYYKNIFGVCEQLVLRPIDCAAGQYFDANNGCVACPGSCKTCSSANKCDTCATQGYTPNSAGVCTPKCGDGIITSPETCDTGNKYSSGCKNCQVQTGYTCTGQPSVCRPPRPAPSVCGDGVINGTETCDTGNGPATGCANCQVIPNYKCIGQPSVCSPSNVTPPPSGKALYQHGPVNVNANNVFATLKTSTTYTFHNDNERQNFIKASFPSGPKPTVYCSQRGSPNLDTFDCLLIYPSGVPNAIFNVDFSFSKNGVNGKATVQVDPFAVTNSRTRGRGRN